MTSDQSEWVGLRRAAEILGVHPATVRNWADKGELASRRTPGGHRRFHKSELTKMSQVQHAEEIQPTEVQVIIQNALGKTRMEIGDGNLEKLPWYGQMSDSTRQQMRIYGRNLLEALRTYLANGAPDDELSTAIRLGHEYAAILVQDNMSLPDAMRGFFYFSEFVINSILTWSEVTPPRSAPEWATLLRHVNNFMNAMLLSMVEYYEEE